jgi:elongation factor P hydroxylase
MSDTIIVKESDLGRWFGIDGKAIKTQEQLDLAIIALAGVYGYKPVRQNQLNILNKVIHNFEGEPDAEMLMAMTAMSEACLKFLNKHLPTGYKFDFEGLAYENFILRKSKSHKREEN